MASGQHPVADAIRPDKGITDVGVVQADARCERNAGRKRAYSRHLPSADQPGNGAASVAKEMLVRTDRQLVGVAVDQPMTNVKR